jgi:hypothetical protein
MKPGDKLADFVGKALADGRSRDDIAAALRAAGWQESEVTRAMEAWADGGFALPVPRPQSIVSARDAFFYGLLFLLLATAVFTINSLGLGLIDLWFSDAEPGTPLPQWVREDFRWWISVLIVVLPLFLWLNVRERRQIATDPARKRSALRKWFCYVTLFFAATGLVGDLMYTVYAFLNGDVSVQFLLKAGLVLVTLALVFYYYWREADLPLARNDLALHALAAIAAGLVVAGFLTVGGPAQGRLEQRDASRLDHLRLLADCLGNFDDAALEKVPATLSEPLPCSGVSAAALTDPLTGEPYAFTGLTVESFQVCARFEGEPGIYFPDRAAFNPQTGCLTIDRKGRAP